MKLFPDAQPGPAITGYGTDWIGINGEKFNSNVIVDSATGASLWEVSEYGSLTKDAFDKLALLRPELIIFGSGQQIRFPKPEWLQNLYAMRIGVETMDTRAACRTFNFLSGEGRKVVAALLLPA